MSAKEPNLQGLSELDPALADIKRGQQIAKANKNAVPPHVAEGKMVSGALKDAVESSITHGLGRKLKGWHLVSPSGDADHVNVIQTGSDANVLKLKNLGATGSLSFSLWVF